MIQPFDQGKFDRRYKDIFKPAIEKAGFDADRVDEDPSVTVVIDRIEKGINDASVCLAEITTNNANVWFELGYALACKKPVLMIREKNARTKFPFDVQHRSILLYDHHTTSDFHTLEAKITERLKAISTGQATVRQLSPHSPEKFADLSQNERTVLCELARQLHDDNGSVSENALVAAHEYRSKTGSKRAIKGPCEKGLIALVDKPPQPENIVITLSPAYKMTPLGWTTFEQMEST
jgi:hypothetical protein